MTLSMSIIVWRVVVPGQEASEETQRLLFIEEAGTFLELVVGTLWVHDDPSWNFLTLKESGRSLLWTLLIY